MCIHCHFVPVGAEGISVHVLFIGKHTNGIRCAALLQRKIIQYRHTFINIADNIVDNDTEYQFVSTNGSSPNRFRLGSIGTWRNVDKTSYELAFTLTFIDSSRCYCKAYFISLQNTSSFDGYFIIRDIITSDNLTTITKKTAAEYEALGSKDANTAYCVTD